jgi:uncharacterized membrane protein YbhN (UPF0104 family)
MSTGPALLLALCIAIITFFYRFKSVNLTALLVVFAISCLLYILLIFVVLEFIFSKSTRLYKLMAKHKRRALKIDKQNLPTNPLKSINERYLLICRTEAKKLMN